MEHMAVVGNSAYADSDLTNTNDISKWAKEANLDWEIKSSPLMFDAGLVDLNGNPIYEKDSSKKVLFRSDSKKRLGIVGKDFKVVQPEQILGFYSKISERLNVNLEAAGWVKGGSLIWGLADLGKSITIKGQDTIKNFLMFSTANDGTRATSIHFVSRRIVCNNMLNYAFNQEGKSPFYVRVPHMTEITPEKEHQFINEIVSQSGEHWRTFEEKANNMSDVGMAFEDAVAFFTEILSVQSRDGVKRLPKEKEPTLMKLVGVYQNGVGQDTRSAKNTLWGAVNAVSRFTDHEINYRNSESAIATAQFGVGNSLKNKAFKHADFLLNAA